MSIRYTSDEAWQFIECAHTGILTTLRRDGRPVTLPTWFVVVDRTICMSTPVRAKKVARVRHDPRAAFLVESGRAWTELAAVHVTGELTIVSDGDVRAAAIAGLDEKYRDFRLPPERLPAAARATYSEREILRLHPAKILSWDNSRISLPG